MKILKILMKILIKINEDIDVNDVNIDIKKYH